MRLSGDRATLCDCNTRTVVEVWEAGEQEAGEGKRWGGRQEAATTAAAGGSPESSIGERERGRGVQASSTVACSFRCNCRILRASGSLQDCSCWGLFFLLSFGNAHVAGRIMTLQEGLWLQERGERGLDRLAGVCVCGGGSREPPTPSTHPP